jgi:NAD-dependent dihydropyrimidine dehydrogenase PreA subunit
MGTMQGAIGDQRSYLQLDEGCKGCRTCERACPMNLRIIPEKREPGPLALADCLKCPECQTACPKGMLHF